MCCYFNINIFMKNGTNRKWHHPFVLCKQKTEVCLPWVANDKW